MDQESKPSAGIVIFMTIVVVAHVACWIASLVKAIIDRKSIRRKMKLREEGSLLGETRLKEVADDGEQKLLKSTEEENRYSNFAITMQQADGNQNMQPSPTRKSSSGEHHFPKYPKRLLSTGGAKRISPEELAIMLDSYAVQPPKANQSEPALRSMTKENDANDSVSVNI